jgi:hypothetical protein
VTNALAYNTTGKSKGLRPGRVCGFLVQSPRLSNLVVVASYNKCRSFTEAVFLVVRDPSMNKLWAT